LLGGSKTLSTQNARELRQLTEKREGAPLASDLDTKLVILYSGEIPALAANAHPLLK
jgi:hypothetical protein